MFKKTKIGATIGPSCQETKIIVQMTKAGMNFARLNFSHGSYENHALLIKNIRKAEKQAKKPIAILQDLQGPKIRIGKMPEKGVELKEKQKITFDTSIDSYTNQCLPIDYSELHEHLKVGERILIDDGHIEVKIEKIQGSKITGVVIEGGMVISHKGMNLPDSKLSISALTDKDKKDLRFGVEHNVDLVAMSFVENAKDILDVKFLIKEYEKELKIKNQPPIRVIAKIERHKAVGNIKEIIEVADGIMVARGDLGLEMPAAEVPLIQKEIIDMANAAAIPVIVATQMLDSMQRNRRPTRAEVSDVANAVIDHADSLMLSNETAVGKHPVLTVKMMAEIAIKAEDSAYDDKELPEIKKGNAEVDDAISDMARILSEELNAKLVIAASFSGETGRLISRVRPNLTILVATNTERVQRQLNISWGIRPFILMPCRSIEELVERSISYIKKNKMAKKGDRMIIVAGEPVGQAGMVNLVEVREIK